MEACPCRYRRESGWRRRFTRALWPTLKWYKGFGGTLGVNAHPSPARQPTPSPEASFQFALSSRESGFVSENGTHSLEQGRMRIVEENIKGMGRQI